MNGLKHYKYNKKYSLYQVLEVPTSFTYRIILSWKVYGERDKGSSRDFDFTQFVFNLVSKLVDIARYCKVKKDI